MRELLYVLFVMVSGFNVASVSEMIAESVRLEHEAAHRTTDPAVIELLGHDE